MKTIIYKTYSDFLDREDKTLNGVSEQFAKYYPDYEKQNEKNDGCWNCSDCYDCYRCSGCYDCSGCSDCSDCYDCSGCSDCSDCSGCSGCYRCSGLKNARPIVDAFPEVPSIENIHQKILEVVSNPNALKMDTFHTCDTTHCRAGWVIHLAGAKGYELENKTSSEFAAMQIYHKSSPDILVSPVRFYETNEKAMEDILRCAELEKASLSK